MLCPNGLRTRPDCRDKIAQHGAIGRIFCMDAAPAAEYAVRQSLAGKSIIVPGTLNRGLAAVSRLVPRTTILAIVSAFWGRTARRTGAAQVLSQRHSTGSVAPSHPVLGA